MKKTVDSKDVLDALAVIEQAIDAGVVKRAKLEIQLLVDNICEDEDDEKTKDIL